MDVVETPRSAADKIREFHSLLRGSIQNRMEALRDEAQTISNDMEALVGRLEDNGHEACLEDIKSARWYRTAAQLSVLKKLYSAWCEIVGVDDGPVRMASGSPDDPDPEEQDPSADEP